MTQSHEIKGGPARLLAFAQRLDAVAEKTGRIVSWLALLLVLVTVYDAAARYGFRAGSVALQELEWHIFAVIFLLGAGYTLKHDGHVRVDVFYARLSDKGRAIVDALGTLFLLIPFCLLVIVTSSGFVGSSWSLGEGSGDPGGLPARYLLKGMIPAGFSLLLLQGVSEFIKNLVRIFRPAAAPPAEKEPVTDGV